MPQVWNPSVSTDQDSGGFSKNSRFTKLSNFSDASLRRIKVRNSLESKLNGIQQAYIRRTSSHFNVRVEQARRNIMDRHRRFKAYKMVLKQHPIKNRHSYQAALNDNYSMHALRHEVRRMIREIDPEIVRRRQAESLVFSSWNKYEETVSHNKDAIGDIVPKPKPVLLPEEEEPVEKSPTPPPAPAPFRRSIIGPSVRGLAHKAQAVTVKMVKEKTWMGTAPSPDKTSVKDLNPHAVLPPIQT